MTNIAPPVLPEMPLEGPALVGHDAARHALFSAWQSGRMHHAWMLTGPMGIGKATLANRFARFALCGGQGDDTLSLDMSIPSVRHNLHLMHSNAHPDFVSVAAPEGKDIIPIDDVRKIEPIFRRTASEGGWRVALIDGADQMNTAAQNAVLKILEEPPARALILLTASVPGRLLPTIRSRVRHLVMEPLSPADMDRLAGLHYPQLEPADRQELMDLAAGSFGAFSLLHQTGALEVHREVLSLLSAPQRSTQGLITFATRLAGKGDEETYATFCKLMQGLLERSCRVAATNTNDLVSGEAELVQALVARIGLAGCLALFDKQRTLFKTTDGLHLDRKQVALASLLDLHSALYGKAA